MARAKKEGKKKRNRKSVLKTLRRIKNNEEILKEYYKIFYETIDNK